MKNAQQIEKILTREEFRRSTMGCFYQDELRAHDRAMRKRLTTALADARKEVIEKVMSVLPLGDDPRYRELKDVLATLKEERV